MRTFIVVMLAACADAPMTGSTSAAIAQGDDACGFTQWQEGWKNNVLPQRSGRFTFTFYVQPTDAEHRPIDVIYGLANGVADDFTDLGPIVRFNPSGTIDARDGDGYRAIATVPYQTTAAYEEPLDYHIRMDVDLPTHHYSAWVTPPGGAEIQIANGFAFRTEQQAMTRIDRLSSYADGGYGTGFFCDGVVTPPVCVDMTSPGSFATTLFPAQNGHFWAEVDATPSASSVDAVVGLANGAVNSFGQLAAIVRFNPDGTFDARDGDTYRAAMAASYVAGATYNIFFDVDVPNGTYSAHVQIPGANWPEIASNFRFRTEQTGVASLDAVVEEADAGALHACDVMSDPF